MKLQASIRKGNEPKLEILKSLLDSYPFGYTLMELYKNFKNEHGIGSRNTLKKYLKILEERGEIQISKIGGYKVFRSKNQFSMKSIFKNYPLLEKISINLFSALTRVLNEELDEKGKLIGQEMAKSSPVMESKAIKQFQKSKDFLKVIPFKQFIESLSEKTILEHKTDVEFVAKENEASLTFKDTKPLRSGAWIFYYIIAGMIETNLNEIFNQQVTVNVYSINESKCVIKIIKNIV